MKKVFKLINAELRKIFLRPTIFIMVAILLVVSFIALLTFSPTEKTNSISVELDGTSVSDIYMKFSSETSEEKDSKKSLDADLLAMINNIESYTTADTSLDEFVLAYNTASDEYKSLAHSLEDGYAGIPEFSHTETKNKLTAYRASIENLEKSFASIFSSNDTPYLIKSELYDNAKVLILTHKNSIQSLGGVETQTSDVYYNILSAMRKTKFYDEVVGLRGYINQIVPKTITTEDFNQLKTKYYDTAIAKLGTSPSQEGTILNEIYKYYSDFTAEETLEYRDAIKKLIANYKSRCLMAKSMINEQLTLLISAGRTDVDMQKYIGYSDFSRITSQSIVTKYAYLIENDLYEVDFLDSLAMGVNSGNETNAYDFLAYAMNILAVVIILFCIVIASKMIAGEQSAGTMKLLAIRPYTRTKILLGKLLAAMFFSLIFLGFALIANFIMGIFIFGLPTENLMIGVFNGTTIIKSHPIVFVLLLTASLFLKMFVYVSLAMMISVLFRSYTGASIVSFSTLIVTLILNMTLAVKSWFKYFPMANLDFYKYFSTNSTASGIKAMFTSPVSADTTFGFTIIYLIATILVLNLISFIAMRRKDIA